MNRMTRQMTESSNSLDSIGVLFLFLLNLDGLGVVEEGEVGG